MKRDEGQYLLPLFFSLSISFLYNLSPILYTEISYGLNLQIVVNYSKDILSYMLKKRKRVVLNVYLLSKKEKDELLTLFTDWSKAWKMLNC